MKAGLLFSGSDALKTLGKTLVFGEERLGNGSLIYMLTIPYLEAFGKSETIFKFTLIAF